LKLQEIDIKNQHVIRNNGDNFKAFCSVFWMAPINNAVMHNNAVMCVYIALVDSEGESLSCFMKDQKDKQCRFIFYSWVWSYLPGVPSILYTCRLRTTYSPERENNYILLITLILYIA